MIDKKFKKDLFFVLLSNGIKLITSILTVFIIPLIFHTKGLWFLQVVFIIFILCRTISFWI